MPRCQRTLRPLDGLPGAASWVCSVCPDAETYECVADSDLLHYEQFAFHAAMREFGKPADASLPLRLIRGLMPECVRVTAPRGYDLYLGSNSDALQLRLQIGHEMFHRVCSQGRIFHWTHEMMACVFSVRLLRAAGFAEYAAQMDNVYRAQARQMPLADLLRADVALPPYAPGLYGRAYVTGDALGNAAGWDAFRTLVALLPSGHPTVPNLNRWRRTLSTAGEARVAELFSA